KILPVSGRFNLEHLSSGNYFINVELKDADNLKLAGTSTFFQLINSSPVVTDNSDTAVRDLFEKVESIDISSTFVGKYDVRLLMAILKILSPIATPVETNSINTFLKRPDESYMRYFIFNFWSARNKQDPKKPWTEYTERVKQVNKMFGS